MRLMRIIGDIDNKYIDEATLLKKLKAQSDLILQFRKLMGITLN